MMSCIFDSSSLFGGAQCPFEAIIRELGSLKPLPSLTIVRLTKEHGRCLIVAVGTVGSGARLLTPGLDPHVVREQATLLLPGYE
jgi:hypothetical protein